MSKTDIRAFDPLIVARYDADMWRAYYDHQFSKLFWLLLQFMKHQFGLDRFAAIRSAYYAGWAAADYRIRRHKGVKRKRVVNNIAQFYKIVSNHNTTPFNYQKAAELEVAWWDIHRTSYKNNPQLEQSLANAAAAIYGVSPKKLRTYAHYRAEAMILPRHKGDKHHAKPTDWSEVTSLLEQSWRALHTAVQKK